jgi:hypothetical protein
MELTKQQLTALRTDQMLQKGKKPYVRVTTVLMLAQGLSTEQVADFLGISPTTVRKAPAPPGDQHDLPRHVRQIPSRYFGFCR